MTDVKQVVNDWGGNCQYHRHALIGGAILNADDRDDQECLAVLARDIDALVAQRVAEEREACADIADNWRMGDAIAIEIRRRGEER